MNDENFEIYSKYEIKPYKLVAWQILREEEVQKVVRITWE